MRERTPRLPAGAVLEHALDDAPFSVVIYEGEELRVAYSNRRHDEIVDRRLMVGDRVLDKVPELAHQPVFEATLRVLRSGVTESASEIETMLARNGALERAFFDVTWQPIQSENGVRAVMVTAVDVTAHVRARAEAEAARRLTDAIASNATLGLVMMDTRQYCTFMNAAAEQIFGFTLAEVRAMNKPLHDIVHHTRPDGSHFPMSECPIDRALPTRMQQRGEDVFIRRDGTFYPVAFTASPILENGVAIGTVIEVEDIRERRRAELALKESERQLREVVDNLPELAWSAQPDGFIDFYNRRWYEFTGTTPAEMQGWGWQKVHDAAMLPKVVAAWRHSLDTGEPFEMEFPLRGANGRFRWFLTRVQPLRDSEGRIVRWIGTNSDVTARREADERTREAVRLRDDFLSIASHELRTPLTAAQLRLDGLIRRLSPHTDLESIRSTLEAVHRQTSRLARLVDDLLDVSRISLGKLTLNFEDVDLGELVNDLAERYSPQAVASGSLMEIECAAPVTGRFDRARLEQVIGNLITNAIKYGEGRPITVRLVREGGAALVMVHDQGIGIAPADTQRIFDRFEQAVPTRNYGGLGLGLFISRQIVEAHGGTLSVESELGRGSTFTVRLPL